MRNFDYYNPTRIVFGKSTIAKLAELVPADSRPLLLYGGGSIKKNGVYDQAIAALENFHVEEFGGIAVAMAAHADQQLGVMVLHRL